MEKKPFYLWKRGKYWYYQLNNNGKQHWLSTGQHIKSEAKRWIMNHHITLQSDLTKISIWDLKISELMEFYLSNLDRPKEFLDYMWIHEKWHEFSHKERKAILFVKQKGRCHYCQCRVYLDGRQAHSNYGAHISHLEHKLPIVKGGSDFFTNVVLACRKCNYEKGIQTDKEYIEIKTPNFDSKDYLTISESAQLLKISKIYIRKNLSEIPHFMVNNQTFFEKDKIMNWFEETLKKQEIS